MGRFVFPILALSVWLTLAAVAAVVTPPSNHGAIGVFGTVASVIGLAYAIIQIAQTRSAAEAARNAAIKTAEKLRKDRLARTLARILETLGEIDKHVTRRAWQDASTQSESLSTQITDLVCMLSATDQVWATLARSARDWSASFADAARGTVTNVTLWRVVRSRIHDKAAKELQVVSQDEIEDE
jgi:hypothetical protein